MDPIHKEALKKCRTRIVRDLMPQTELWDLLLQYDIFTPMMLEYIEAEKTRTDKNRKLLDDLARRGPEAYGKFLICLRESGHGSIADTIVEWERLTRRQKDPNYSDPTPATSGTKEGQILYSGAAASQPLSRENRNQNSLGNSINPPQSNALQAPNIGQNVPPQTQNITQNTQTQGDDISQEEEMMLLDEDVLDGMQPLPVPSAPVPSSAPQGAQQSQYQSLYEIQNSRGPDNEMILAMNDFAHDQNLRNVDSIAVIFSSQNCPAMYNKPKLMIINACRGEGTDLGSSPSNEHDTVNRDVTSIGFSEDRNVNRKVANFQDDVSSWRQIPAPTISLIKTWLLNPPIYQS
ncbi:hypothetical protein KUTeg_001783 [Tegillarca granosa]|uniref:Uncharacterized protein n=1 Tax=Tegillarca granosa TaxID=220873 RepID=A0ABQ9FSF5_TEGGR|nr:hypothetical protein KUTeg_001783 [Tegillarca granosa]